MSPAIVCEGIAVIVAGNKKVISRVCGAARGREGKKKEERKKKGKGRKLPRKFVGGGPAATFSFSG
jgi:hypothetical protein